MVWHLKNVYGCQMCAYKMMKKHLNKMEIQQRDVVPKKSWIKYCSSKKQGVTGLVRDVTGRCHRKGGARGGIKKNKSRKIPGLSDINNELIKYH